MSLEENERSHLDDLKAEEKRSAEADVYRTLSEMEKKPTPQQSAAEKQQTTQSGARGGGRVGSDDPDDDSGLIKSMLLDDPSAAGRASGKKELDVDKMLAEMEEEEQREARAATLAAAAKAEEEYELVNFEGNEGYDEDIAEAYTPEPRANGGVVKFNFTPRIFPTPMRESKASEEEDWIAKNRSHLRRNPTLKPQLDAMDIEDSDPTWLKGKGDDFYRCRDYRAAVNAYTTALELNPELLPVLSNRGACYLALGDLVHCIEDCDALLMALDREGMSKDANPSDLRLIGMRVKGLARRGTAKCQQGSYGEALGDYQRAVGLSPSDPSLVADLRKVFGLAKCAELKKQADALLGEGDLQGALDKYSSALAVEPTFVSAISNRAACYLALGRPEDCAADCCAALDLLAVDPADQAAADERTMQAIGAPTFGGATAGGRGQAMPSGPVPPVGSSKRRTWVLKTVARRGAAYAQLGRYTEAVEDYTTACSLCPGDEALKRDLDALVLTAAAAPTTGSQMVLEPANTTGFTGDGSESHAPPVMVAPVPPSQRAKPTGDSGQPKIVEPDAIPGMATTRTTAIDGWGRIVEPGTSVTVHAEGALEGGCVFWNTREGQGVPFTYTAGKGSVIRGWDQGCMGMKVGERRVLNIPPSEGYGTSGFAAWKIPGGATLRFTLDCIAVEGP